MSLTKATYSMIEGAPVNVLDFGAVGDGVTDDTAAIQAAINSISATGGIIEGSNKTYCVTSCNLVSNLLMQNFNFITKAGSTDLVSPITIGAYNDTGTKENITLVNIHIDGNRANQTNIGLVEDGGRHGFRIIGKTKNITIQNCSANYCATDGIVLYRGIGTNNTWPTFENILVENCTFEWNRRHGHSADSCLYVTFKNCRFNNNGQDINGGGPANSGLSGATVAGVLYGNGVDLEMYGAGFHFENYSFENCVALQNARNGFLIIDPTNATTPGWSPSKFIKFLNCEADVGTVSIDSAACAVTPLAGVRGTGTFFKNLVFEGCNFKGRLLISDANAVSIDGGYIEGSSSFAGVAINTSNIVVGTTNLNSLVFSTTNSIVQYLQKPISITIPSGGTYDFGLPRTTTYGVLTIYDRGSLVPGGLFAAIVYLGGGANAYVTQLQGTTVGTTGSDLLQVVTTSTNWQLKNNSLVTMNLTYGLLN